MTDQSQEPTMEEILASIRRIISEDDQPAETSAPVAEEPVLPTEAIDVPEVQPEPEPAPFPAAEPLELAADEDVFELTETYEAPPVETIGDLDVFVPDEPSEPVIEPEPVAAVRPTPDYDALVGESAAASAASAFAGLHALKKPSPAPQADLGFMSGATVEGMVAEMLRPMLKDWLDTHLPDIVETAVKKEVERIARNA